ncbi:hypothetical protein N7495_001880 [Penicillium taxi]|uniref:uncharacterized protein n=1 Tax=Penicillium taxi TaxID=168475 RepID=UPI002545267E|nr:uncharacterized protein N7495_001880 [Penicillium taxi]KAJ5909198.1 hypothetical protein N7495_001880 [Penicillium taxi]
MEKTLPTNMAELNSSSLFPSRETLAKEESIDNLDPKNWSPMRKTGLLLALVFSSLLADGAMTWGSTLITQQAIDWNITINHSATSMNYGILLQGFGGIFAVPLIEAYGRYPIWLWSQVITMFMVLGATLSNDYSTFTTFRSLQGFFGTVPQVVGLPIIHDMYSPDEWPRMINIWGTTFLVGPFLGPAIAGYIGAATSWRVSFGVLTALYGLSTVIVVLFGHETYYLTGKRAEPSLASYFGFKDTQLSKKSTLAYWTRSIVVYTFKIPLFLIGIAVLVTFTWPIGITTTIDTFLHSPPYMFDIIQASSMRFAGVIGALGGWVIGHLLNEWIYNRHRNNWCVEYRLHGVWIPIGSLVGGLLTYGLTLNFAKHWMGLAFGWIMVNIGMVATIVTITAYALEKYPDQSTCVSAILNMWRTCGGFAVGYFQPAWIARNGIGLVFGIQAAVLCVAIIMTVTPVLLMDRTKLQVIEETELGDVSE